MDMYFLRLSADMEYFSVVNLFSAAGAWLASSHVFELEDSELTEDTRLCLWPPNN